MRAAEENDEALGSKVMTSSESQHRGVGFHGWGTDERWHLPRRPICGSALLRVEIRILCRPSTLGTLVLSSK